MYSWGFFQFGVSIILFGITMSRDPGPDNFSVPRSLTMSVSIHITPVDDFLVGFGITKDVFAFWLMVFGWAVVNKGLLGWIFGRFASLAIHKWWKWLKYISDQTPISHRILELGIIPVIVHLKLHSNIFSTISQSLIDMYSSW